MVYLIILSVIAGVLGLYYFFIKDLNLFKKHDIPHIRPLPVVGNMGPTLFRMKSLAELVKNLYDVHPEAKYIGMYDMMNKPIVMLRDPELIKSITLKHFETFPDRRTFVGEDQDPLFSNNLFFLRGNRWREVRSVLSPAFTSSKMKGMFKLMSDCAIDFGKFVSQLPPQQRVMDMKDIFAKYTNDVIASCAFGVSVDSMRDPKNLFYVYGKEATSFNGIIFLKFFIFMSLPWLAKILKLKLVREHIAKFFKHLVEITIKTRNEKGIVRPDMLQLMIESKGKKEGMKDLTIEDMTSHAFVFFFAGFDGTSTAMCFAAHEIAVNEDIQKRLQDEIDQVLEDTNGQSPYEVVNNMEYLEAVVNETLRMYPIAVMMDRLCIKDFELPPTLPGTKPFILKKGQGIWIPAYGLQHDPKHFEEPERFNPDRFFGDRKKHSISSGTYLPFGLGPRMCIGNRFALMETKVVLFHLLARCDLLPCEKTQIPLKLNNDFNLKAKGGYWLKVVPRKNPHRTVVVNVNDNVVNSL